MRSYCTTTKTLFISLDVGKNVHWLGGYRGHDLTVMAEPLALRTNKAGFEQATSLIDGLRQSGQFDQVILGHEPTGVYHETWARALYDRYVLDQESNGAAPVIYCYLNPLVVKRKREQLNQGRSRKTDKLDLLAIAACLRDLAGREAYLPNPQALRFQLWSRNYRTLAQERRRLSIAILAQLDRLWPGAVVNVRRFRQMHPDLEIPTPLVLSKPLDRQRVQAILQHCPNPHDFLALGQDGIQAFYRQHLGRCGQITANLAFSVVNDALLPPPDIAAVLADDIQADFAHYLSLEHRLQHLRDQAETLIAGTPAQILTTIPGISPFLAARYLAYLGDPNRFDTAAQVWAFAGFDPILSESGDTRRIGQISCKGDPGFRDTLYLIGLHTANQIPSFAQTKLKARARGKNAVGATIHVAHRANRLCFQLLQHQVPFDPTRVR